MGFSRSDAHGLLKEELRILDSLVILDNWKWHKENIMPGTSK
jgi:folate-dependent tRNA-U54 methylase TrmFO/GidA